MISCSMISKYSMSATPAGMKKNPMFLTKMSAIDFTDFSWMIPFSSAAVSKTIPMMLPGKWILKSFAMISPIAQNPKMIVVCLIMDKF